MSILTVQHLEKHFENTKVLNDISFSLEEGQALSILHKTGHSRRPGRNRRNDAHRCRRSVDDIRQFGARYPVTGRITEPTVRQLK